MKNSLFNLRAWAAAFLGLGLIMVMSACGKTAVAPDAEVTPPVSQNEAAPPAPSAAQPEDGLPEPPTLPTDMPTEPIEPGAMYSLDQVALHGQAGDCWLAIDGRVYDVSSFTPDHPGGEAILQGCGQDASGIFNARHDDRAKSLLPNFYIGDLR